MRKIEKTATELGREHDRDRATIRRVLERAGIAPRRDGHRRLYNARAASEAIKGYLENRGRSPRSEALNAQKLGEQIRKLRIANDNKEAALVHREKLNAACNTYLSKVESMLARRLGIEYGNAAALDVPGARALGRQTADAIIAEMRSIVREAFAEL